MSFQQSLSGIYGASTALDVIGNNIANSSTVGFKGGNAKFSDVFSASLSRANTATAGFGSQALTIKQQFKQGDITPSNNPLDVAINGNGMFQFTDALSGTGNFTYSRNGQLQIKAVPDSSTPTDPATQHSYLVNANGQYLTGWAAGVATTQTPAPLELVEAVSFQPTTTSNLVVNLNAAVSFPLVASFDPNDPQSYNFATPQTVYDSNGDAHSLVTYFTRGATVGDWDVDTRLISKMPDGTTVVPSPSLNLVLPDGTVEVVTAPSSRLIMGDGSILIVEAPAEEAGGARQLTFTNNILSSGSPLVSTFALRQTTATMSPITIDFTKQTGTSTATSTQYGSDFTVDYSNQDGVQAGTLSGFSILADGTIEGKFTNGSSSSLGQIALATFTNVNGLRLLGDNMWAATTGYAMSSGAADVKPPGQGNHGVLQGGAVENSNVDLNEELVNMIFQQRNYQSNAQAVKAQDSLLQTLVSIKS